MLFLGFLLVSSCLALPLDVDEAESTNAKSGNLKAASPLTNCGCQCSSLTFSDSAGVVQVNDLLFYFCTVVLLYLLRQATNHHKTFFRATAAPSTVQELAGATLMWPMDLPARTSPHLPGRS